MKDAILDMILMVLFAIGSVSLLGMLMLIFTRDHRLSIILKWCFFISVGLELIIIFFLMDTERQLIPVLGFSFLIMTTTWFSWTSMIGLRTYADKKSSKEGRLFNIGIWGFLVSASMLIVWLSIWWKELYG